MRSTFRRSGFTLIELLTAIAIIGLLAAILIPSVASVRRTAKNTTTRSMFSQVIGAVELFKNEYGYYPNLNSQRGSNDFAPNPQFGKINYVTGSNSNTELLFQALTGRNIDGAKTGFDPRDSGNIRFVQFYSVSQDSFKRDTRQIVDAFNNTDIVLLMDVAMNQSWTDGSNVNKASDGYIVLPNIGVTSVVNPESGELKLAEVDGPQKLLATAEGRKVRANVIMYSAGLGRDYRDIVKSWGP